MDPSTPTPPQNEPDNDELSTEVAQDEEELSSGNNRLALIAGGIVVAVLAGYLLLPATVTQRRTAPEPPAPVMELGEATVTGAAAADSAFAAAPTTPTTAPTAASATTAAATEAGPAAIRSAAVRNAPAEAAAEPGDEQVLAPVVPAAPVALEPVELAPTTLNMSGRVFDESGRPLAGATIMLKGSKNVVTSTDAKGNYSIEVPAGTENTLLYGYGGYEDQVLRSRNANPQTVTLVPKEGAKRRRR